MNIGIDIDDTITAMPEFFATLTKAFAAAGHRIHVISFRAIEDRADTTQELEGYGIQYDTLTLSEGGESISQFKGRAVQDKKIDVLIDDMPEAFVALPANVKRLWLCDEAFYPIKEILRALK